MFFFLVLTMSPFVVAQSDNDAPAWEIGLAIGSGSLALVLCLFAIVSYRQNGGSTTQQDVEVGVKTGAVTLGNSQRSHARTTTKTTDATQRTTKSAPSKSKSLSSSHRKIEKDIDHVVTSSTGLIQNLGNAAEKTVEVFGKAKSGIETIGSVAATKAKETNLKIANALRDDPDDPRAREEAKALAIKKAASSSSKNEQTKVSPRSSEVSKNRGPSRGTVAASRV